MAVLTASSSSARQLYQILRCIAFSPKAHVEISASGLKFSVDDARTMQGFAFLEKDLFTSYSYAPEAAPSDDASPTTTPAFQISLPALLETLQIFGASEQKDAPGSFTGGIGDAVARSHGAFDSATLGLPGLCRLRYDGAGHPLRVHLEEGSVTTTCDLAAYEPDAADEIPFDRERLALKIIMRAAWLADALAELAAVAPERVAVAASPDAPFFALAAAGSTGSVAVEFARHAPLLETFQVPRRARHVYKFSMLRAATRAMAAASKVSVRGDVQGVLSLQFMLEMEGGGVSFVDFRFVPYAAEEGDESEEG